MKRIIEWAEAAWAFAAGAWIYWKGAREEAEKIRRETGMEPEEWERRMRA